MDVVALLPSHRLKNYIVACHLELISGNSRTQHIVALNEPMGVDTLVHFASSLYDCVEVMWSMSSSIIRIIPVWRCPNLYSCIAVVTLHSLHSHRSIHLTSFLFMCIYLCLLHTSFSSCSTTVLDNVMYKFVHFEYEHFMLRL